MYQWLYPVFDKRYEPRGECVLDQVDPECDRALRWVRREAIEWCCEPLCWMLCWNECALRVTFQSFPAWERVLIGKGKPTLFHGIVQWLVYRKKRDDSLHQREKKKNCDRYSLLMDAMAKLVDFNHVFSTVFHPQINGTVEHFNTTFVPRLTKRHDRENNNWDEYVSPVVFAYNTGAHATMGFSAFQLQFGREARLPQDKPVDDYVFHRPADYHSQWRKSLSIIHRLARATIVSSQSRYKRHYDHHRSDPQYEVNDQVLTKVQGGRSKLQGIPSMQG